MGDGSRRINGIMGVMSKLKWNSESHNVITVNSNL